MPADELPAGTLCLSLALAGPLRNSCCCTCCSKHRRWRPELSWDIGYYTIFPSQGPAIFWLFFQKIVEATLWAWMGLRKRAWNKSKGGRAQLLKEWHRPYNWVTRHSNRVPATWIWIPILGKQFQTRLSEMERWWPAQYFVSSGLDGERSWMLGGISSRKNEESPS